MTNQAHIDPEIAKEEKIIEASKKDLGEFEYLYNKYFESIFRYVFHRVGDEAETGDIVSRIFMNAMNGLDKYECRGLPFGAWLFRIASNEVKKKYRAGKVQMLCIEEERLADLWTCGEVDDSDSRIKILEHLVQHLDDEEINILQFKFFEDMNFKEIALLLDKKESAVKMRMYRALDKLKEQFQVIEKNSL